MRALILLIALWGSLAVAQGRPQGSPVKPKPVHQAAAWNGGLEAFLGLTESQFQQAGLAKLSSDELTVLIKALLDGKNKTSVLYSCGPREAKLDFVRVLVDASNDSDSELVSAIRQRLRGISDVEIVYNRDEADLRISIIAARDQTKAGNPLGFTASSATATPCRVTYGEEKWTEDFFQGHSVAAGPTAKDVAETLISGLDTSTFERIRKSHAETKSFLKRLAPKTQ